jgi:16S rRNA processing protein RimM
MAATAIVGRIVKTVGLKGEVKLNPGPDFWSDALRAPLDVVFEDSVERSVRVTGCRTSGHAFVVRLEGIDTIDEAQKLVGRTLSADLGALGEAAPPERALPCQFIGLAVRLADGSTLGTVVDLLLGPSQDCLIVEGNGQRYLVPNVPGLVMKQDFAEGFIEINPPEGLLDLRW